MSSSGFAALCSAFGKYDVVHIHAEGPAFFAWLPKLLGKRVVVTIHGIDWQREKWQSGLGSTIIKSTPQDHPSKPQDHGLRRVPGQGRRPGGGPGPQALRRLVNENIRYRSHKYTGEKRKRENLKITLKRGIMVVRTSRV